jgi:hypothetical protein
MAALAKLAAVKTTTSTSAIDLTDGDDDAAAEMRLKREENSGIKTLMHFIGEFKYTY